MLGTEHPGQVQRHGWGCPSQGRQAVPQGSSLLGDRAGQGRGEQGVSQPAAMNPLTTVKGGCCPATSRKCTQPGKLTALWVQARWDRELEGKLAEQQQGRLRPQPPGKAGEAEEYG